MTHRWETTNFTPEAEHPRPEFYEQLKDINEKTINVITQEEEPKVPIMDQKKGKKETLYLFYFFFLLLIFLSKLYQISFQQLQMNRF